MKYIIISLLALTMAGCCHSPKSKAKRYPANMQKPEPYPQKDLDRWRKQIREQRGFRSKENEKTE